MRRKIVLAVLILVTFLLQTTVFQFLSIASVAPNLLLILTASFGLLRGKKGCGLDFSADWRLTCFTEICLVFMHCCICIWDI